MCIPCPVVWAQLLSIKHILRDHHTPEKELGQRGTESSGLWSQPDLDSNLDPDASQLLDPHCLL